MVRIITGISDNHYSLKKTLARRRWLMLGYRFRALAMLAALPGISRIAVGKAAPSRQYGITSTSPPSSSVTSPSPPSIRPRQYTGEITPDTRPDVVSPPPSHIRRLHRHQPQCTGHSPPPSSIRHAVTPVPLITSLPYYVTTTPSFINAGFSRIYYVIHVIIRSHEDHGILC